MKQDEIKQTRFKIGRFLHEYYKQYGEEKYEKFLEKISKNIGSSYDNTFSKESLRIMEAEYVILKKNLINENDKK